MKPSDYILTLNKDSVDEFKEIGFTIYAIGDGTYHAVAEDAPQESHDLAISAIEGYPDAIDEVRGFKLPMDKDNQPTANKGDSSSISAALSLK